MTAHSSGGPRVSRRAALALAAGTVVGSIGFHGRGGLGLAVGQPSASRTARDIKRELAAAMASDDGRVVERLFDELWAVDRREALEGSGKLLSSSRRADRPLGAAMLARHASVDEVYKAVRTLDAQKFQVERRYLVRHLGKAVSAGDTDQAKKEKSASYRVCTGLLEDTDRQVRGAAATALAVLGDVNAVELLMKDLRTPPVVEASFADSDEAKVNAARYGAIHALTPLRPRASQDVAKWWRETGGKFERTAAASDPREAQYPAVTYSGRPAFELPSFDLQVRVKGMSAEAPTGVLAPAEVARWGEAAVRTARVAFERVMGPIRVPPVRLLLMDEKQFSSEAGITFMAGVSHGNEVVMKVGMVPAMTSTLAHEYVHVIQSMLFRKQPRWMMEGMAQSLEQSPSAPGRFSKSEIKDRLGTGWERQPVTQIIAWDESATSDAREVQRYRASHALFDFLRHTRFSVPEVRVGFLMGYRDRAQSSREAMESAYGWTMEQLDNGLGAWMDP